MLSLFELVAALLGVTALFAWLNARLIRLPTAIGLLVMGLAASLLLVGSEFVFPDAAVHGVLTATLRQIDFYDTVMNGLLAFLLFAGALHVDFDRLRRRAPVIGTLASLGVVMSALIVATGLWLAAGALDLPLDFAWALVFGALIAPTDPVAVLSTLQAVKVPPALETDMSGEALFNDGIGVVLFAITLEAAHGMAGDFGLAHVAQLLLVEAGGGALFGLLTGALAYRAMYTIDEPATEVMISLALVTGTYALANALGMSGPISVVTAGLLIGNRGAARAMSEFTRRYVFGFWTLTDEILNAVLFLLIGVEVLVIGIGPAFGWIGLIAIPLTLFARFVSVATPVAMLRRWQSFVPGTVAIMTWGGVRGGISIALALSLPDVPARTPILAATYGVVLFTVIVQGLSLAPLVRRMVGAPALPEAAAE